MRTLSFVNVLTSSFVLLREVEEASSFLGQSNQGKIGQSQKRWRAAHLFSVMVYFRRETRLEGNFVNR